jgi:hypothetical protein
VHFVGRLLAATCLCLAALSGALRSGPQVGAAVLPGWHRLTYGGAVVAGTRGRPAAHVASYSLAYPPGWSARWWPDTLASFGQLSLWSPSGETIDVVLLPVRGSGPTLADLVAHDAASLSRPVRDHLVVPPGTMVRLRGLSRNGGVLSQFLYLQRHAMVYRLVAAPAVLPVQAARLEQIAASLKIPAAKGATTSIPPPLAPSHGATCCHCPAWGTGWGAILTSLDGVPVFSNAGNVDNGCDSTFGISYQCVELVQRYFALRWGYPAIWRGVAAAADMRLHHPEGITFIPNGGAPEPQEGDALLLYGGAFGHVALVRQVDRRGGAVEIVEENWSSTGKARLTMFPENTLAIRESGFGSYTVAGWLHSQRQVSAR